MRPHLEPSCPGRPVFVGIDYHQGSVHVVILDAAGREVRSKSCSNDVLEVASVCPTTEAVQGVAIEACSGAADFAQKLAELTGWSVELAHPGYVSRMKQTPDKSDRTDAWVLADLTRVGYLPRVWLAPTYIRELRQLDSLRDSVAAEIRRHKQRIRSILRDQRVRPPASAGSPWTRAWLAWVGSSEEISPMGHFSIGVEREALDAANARLRLIERTLRAMTKNDPVVKALRREPGIGEVISWKLRARIGRFDRFRSGKQLAHFCGLSPQNASSGQRNADAGLIRTCDKSLRAMLLQAAHCLKQHNARWRTLARQMLGRGLHHNVVTAAVANRWVRGLYHRMLAVRSHDPICTVA